MPHTVFPEVCSGLMRPASLPLLPLTHCLAVTEGATEWLNGNYFYSIPPHTHTHPNISAGMLQFRKDLKLIICDFGDLLLVHYKFQWDSADSFWGQPGVNTPAFITCCGQERERIWQPNVFRDVFYVSLWTVTVLADESLREGPSLQAPSAPQTRPGESTSTWASSTQWAWLALYLDGEWKVLKVYSSLTLHISTWEMFPQQSVTNL